MLITEEAEPNLSITKEAEEELLDMIRNEFPELSVNIFDTDPKLMMPRYVFVRYKETDLITIFGIARVTFIVDKLEFISQKELFSRTKGDYLINADVEVEPKIIGTGFLKKLLTLDEYRTLFRKLIDDYNKLSVVQKSYEVQKKIEQIKKDF